MHAALSPLLIGLAIGVVALGALLLVGRAALERRRRNERARLPHGADAALWSIVEAMPDPRNHLALTRDLSGEVHITDLDRATALALAQANEVIAAGRAREREQVIELTDPVPEPTQTPAQVATADFTTADGHEDLTLTGSLFFSGPPQLSRF